MIRKVNIWQELDWITVLIYALLVIFGWINIYAAVYDDQHQSIFDFSQRYGKQLIWIVAGGILALIAVLIDTKFYSFFSYGIYALSLLLLISVLFLGKEVNGARSWFYFAGLQIQPTEFAKIGTCLALAKYLSTYSIRLNSFWAMVRSIAPVMLIILLPMAFIGLQPDWGSALVYIALVLVLYREGLPGTYLVGGFTFGLVFVFALIWRATPESLIIMLFWFFLIAWFYYNRRIPEIVAAVFVYFLIYFIFRIISHYSSFEFASYFKHLACLLGSIVTLVAISYTRSIRYVFWLTGLLTLYIGFGYGVTYIFDHVLESHQRNRIEIFLGQKYDPKKEGYNIEQSKIAIGSGGFNGKGFLKGTQTKYNFVPEQSTDFIFCTVGEEWGFLGSFVILSLFLGLLMRLLVLCERQRSVFSRIFGYGVVSIFFIHTAINIGMTIGLFPVIGIPLPFFSYGGSSLWAFTILLFVFLRFDASRMEMFR